MAKHFLERHKVIRRIMTLCCLAMCLYIGYSVTNKITVIDGNAVLMVGSLLGLFGIPVPIYFKTRKDEDGNDKS